MDEALTLLDPINHEPQTKKSAARPGKLRREVDNMLRDVAFVLAQTRRVRNEIVDSRRGSSEPRP